MESSKNTNTDKVQPEKTIKDAGYVSIEKETLDSILTKLASNEKQIERLMKAADKGRLAHIDQQNKGPLVRTVRISRLGEGGPLVVGWKMTVNESFIDAGNRWQERQEVDVFLDNAETRHMNLLDFYRTIIKKDVAEIVSTVEGNDGSKEYLVQFTDGRQVKIGMQFVN